MTPRPRWQVHRHDWERFSQSGVKFPYCLMATPLDESGQLVSAEREVLFL
jgi:hypothetical protein